ncbi:hypothetical protein [Mangrovivirga cuniculi]|nr:hypothetical protein [Mangrovivirga cuniculi]
MVKNKSPAITGVPFVTIFIFIPYSANIMEKNYSNGGRKKVSIETK